MSTSPLSDSAKEMLLKANPAVISTVRSDGQPVSAATWYLLRGDQLMVNMDHGRKRLEHLRNDPRVSLTVLDDGDWYTHVTIIGRVTQMYDDDGLADIDALSRHYTGQEYQWPVGTDRLFGGQRRLDQGEAFAFAVRFQVLRCLRL